MRPVERSEGSASLRTVLVNGTILGHPDADMIILEGDSIAHVGRSADPGFGGAEATDVETINLQGRFVSPGFVDAHIHLVQTGLVESGWLVGLAGLSRSETLAKLSQASAERQGDWVVGHGWDESIWCDRGYLTRAELDAIGGTGPVLAVRVDGHLLAANSEAMKRVPETLPAELVDGRQGILRETAASAMLQSARPDHAAVREALWAAAGLCHRLGITSVHTMTRHEHWDEFEQHREERRLRITFCPEIAALDGLLGQNRVTGTGDPWLQYGGVKIFADGSIGAGNAAVSEPYLDRGLGALNHGDDELRSWVEKADAAGWQTVIHAIGDRAIEQVIAVHAAVCTNPERRHRLEHVELPTERQLGQMKRLGLCASMQPNFTANWSGPGGLYEERLGSERNRRSNPLRTLHDLAIPLGFGSDGMPPGPLYGLKGAVCGVSSVQRLEMEEALYCYTLGGAWLGFIESRIGSLCRGKWADLVVLDEDPRLDPQSVSDRRVEMTWVGGQLVYARDGLLPSRERP